MELVSYRPSGAEVWHIRAPLPLLVFLEVLNINVGKAMCCYDFLLLLFLRRPRQGLGSGPTYKWATAASYESLLLIVHISRFL